MIRLLIGDVYRMARYVTGPLAFKSTSVEFNLARVQQRQGSYRLGLGFTAWLSKRTISSFSWLIVCLRERSGHSWTAEFSVCRSRAASYSFSNQLSFSRVTLGSSWSLMLIG